MSSCHFQPAQNPVHATTVFSVSFERHDKSTRAFDLVDLERELSNAEVMSWVDIQGPDIGALNEVLSRMGIDLVLVSHFDEPEILPRTVEHADSLAFYLYEIENPDQHLDTSHGLRELHVQRLILIIGEGFILTYHRTPLDVIDHVKANCAESFRLWGRTQGFIMFLFLERCLYDYANLNLANDNYLDHLEQELIAGDAVKLAHDVAVAAGNILTLKKITASLHIVLMLLGTKRSIFVSDDARLSYQEMNQNVVAVRAAIDSSTDLLNGVIGSVQANASQRTGEIARVLTVVSAIILPLSLMTGIYGMNFDYMPELKSGIGYFVVLGAMLTLASVLIGIFWKLGWLSSFKKPGQQHPADNDAAKK